MPGFSGRNIIIHLLHVENEDEDTGIVCNMIIDQYQMAQLGLRDDFKSNLLEWDGTYVPMKNILSGRGSSLF